MTDPKMIDARGLSCPEPAMLTRQALLELGTGALVVLTDSATSRNNIERTGKLVGWRVEVSQDADESYKLMLTK